MMPRSICDPSPGPNNVKRQSIIYTYWIVNLHLATFFLHWNIKIVMILTWIYQIVVPIIISRKHHIPLMGCSRHLSKLSISMISIYLQFNNPMRQGKLFRFSFIAQYLTVFKQNPSNFTWFNLTGLLYSFL